MRKYLIGALVGIALTYSTTAFGDEISKVGKKIQGEANVVVDGSSLGQKAIIVDGMSYAPLRAIADSTGYNVSYTNNTVTFTNKESVPVTDTNTGTTDQTTTETPPPSATDTTTDQGTLTLKQVELNIETDKSMIVFLQDSIERLKNSSSEDVPNAADEITRLQGVLAEKQADLEKWEKVKSDLEAMVG